MPLYKYCSVFLMALFAVVGPCNAQGDQDTMAIKKQAESYIKAYNAGDARGLAKLWAPDAEYVTPETGQVISGRDAIEMAFQSVFNETKKSNLEAIVTSITFPAEDKAVETGTAIVKRDGEEDKRTAYKAMYEKIGNEWLLTEVREVETIEQPTNFDKLKELDWMVGNWVDEDDDVKITSKIAWDKYKNFLTQQFTVHVEGNVELEGRQLIAWDPINEKIRSWVFDSDGGFGEGKWVKKGDSWVVETAQTLTDGRRASSINIYTPVDSNSYTWESVGREVGGELLPSIPLVTVKKVEGEG